VATLKRKWLFFRQAKKPPYTTKQAFSQLYDKTHIAVFRYAYGLVHGNQHDAEDITAQTFLKAWDARHQFTGTPTQAQSWLFTIAKRIVIDQYRKQQVRPDEVAMPDTLHNNHPSPEKIAMQADEHQQVWAILQHLDEADRDMIVLRYMLDWQVKDIATHMNMNPNSVSVRLKRLMEQLQGLWLQQVDEEA
jgi:RNA polymerase sigma-70 factor (ECF subfamily)